MPTNSATLSPLIDVSAGAPLGQANLIVVRMALGAGRGDVSLMVLRESMQLVAIGVVLGASARWPPAHSWSARSTAWRHVM